MMGEGIWPRNTPRPRCSSRVTAPRCHERDGNAAALFNASCRANNRCGQRFALQVFHHNLAVRLSALEERGSIPSHRSSYRGRNAACPNQDFELRAGFDTFADDQDAYDEF
jgi:hypothetical protein